jgi:imidazolonepropionase-like amidohydrolase
MIQVIKGAKVITGKNEKPIEKGMIIIEDNEITTICRQGEAEIPSSAVVHDLGEEVVLPGLVDAHSHSAPTPGQGTKKDDPDWKLLLSAARNIRADLKAGVTSIRSLGDINFIDLYLKQAVESGIVPGPRMSVSTRGIKGSARPGLWSIAVEANGAQDIRTAVRENVEAGADWIKIFITGTIKDGGGEACYYSAKEIEAAVDEAHKLGKPVSAHVYGGKGLGYCLKVGVDTIEHGGLLTDEDIEIFLKKGIWLVPTFNPLFRQTVLENLPDQATRDRVRDGREIWKKNFLKAYRAGVKCAMGTDARHGWQHYEMSSWVQFGIAPSDVIIAATSNSAAACRMGDKVGSLEPGKAADIISVRGDPLQDIKFIQDLGMVMKDGQRYDSMSLE